MKYDRTNNELKTQIQEKKLNIDTFKTEKRQTENKLRRLNEQKDKCLSDKGKIGFKPELLGLIQ